MTSMVTKGFSYESVFRYLRCGMSGITREQADQLENYVLALGIRGWHKWSEKWVRTYRIMKDGDIQEIGNLCLLKYLGGNTFVAFQVSGDHCDLSVFQILFPDHSADSPCRFFQFFDGGFLASDEDE